MFALYEQVTGNWIHSSYEGIGNSNKKYSMYVMIIHVSHLEEQSFTQPDDHIIDHELLIDQNPDISE